MKARVLVLVAALMAGVAIAQTSQRLANNVQDVADQITNAQRVTLLTSSVPAELLNALLIAGLNPAVQMDVYLPAGQVLSVAQTICGARATQLTPGSQWRVRMYQHTQWATPTLSASWADDSSVLMQGPLVAGKPGETRITQGEVLVSNAGLQVLAVLAKDAVLAYAC